MSPRRSSAAATRTHRPYSTGTSCSPTPISENSPFFIAAYLGIIRAGLCVVPFQVDARDKTLQRIVGSTGMKRILVSARFRSRVEPLAARLGVPMDVEPGDRAPQAEPPAALPEVDPRRDLASLMLTSGSTGQPKGVMVTHRNIACNTRDILQYLGIGADDRAMVVLPFHHCYGASLMHTHLAAGGSLVLNNRFMFPEKVLDEIEEKRCTGRSCSASAASPSGGFPRSAGCSRPEEDCPIPSSASSGRRCLTFGCS
jgi:long-chain acyl-CoA synthetase